jgi:hypothetical protein
MAGEKEEQKKQQLFNFNFQVKKNTFLMYDYDNL